MRLFSNWLYRVSSGRVALAALGIFLLFTALVLPRQAASAELNAGGAGSPDMSFYYSGDDLYLLANSYGEQGRQAYIRARWTFDLIWPLVYAFFLSTAISWVYNRAFMPERTWRLANLAPILGLVFDYLENISTSLVMLRFPLQTPIVDMLAPIFTSLKWIFVGGSFVLLVLGTAVAAWAWIKDRQ